MNKVKVIKHKGCTYPAIEAGRIAKNVAHEKPFELGWYSEDSFDTDMELAKHEELEQALADYKKMHPSIVHPYYLKLLDRIAELNTIIGSSDELT
jgi:hypothetical protein